MLILRKRIYIKHFPSMFYLKILEGIRIPDAEGKFHQIKDFPSHRRNVGFKTSLASKLFCKIGAPNPWLLPKSSIMQN